MALKRAAFSLRRRRSLGFSKCRWLRTSFNVPSRSIFFFNRRSARSTDSPFFSLISVNSNSLPSRDRARSTAASLPPAPAQREADDRFRVQECQRTKLGQNLLARSMNAKSPTVDFQRLANADLELTRRK